MIEFPDKGEKLVVGVSGGKDSTAVCLYLQKLGFTPNSYKRVFCDTGWENESTYKHLEDLEKIIGKIDRIEFEAPTREDDLEFINSIENQLGFKSPMIRFIIYYGYFPSGKKRWCTSKLKLKPLEKYLNDLEFIPINVTGIRKEEGNKRAKMQEWEWADHFDCWNWRPIIDWSESDVINIHKEFGVIPNRLYLKEQMSRVGCWPCIYARKKEIAQLDKNRIDIIRQLENYVTSKHDKKATFFRSDIRGSRDRSIDEVIEWSATSRGGNQFELFDLRPPTCRKWGLCGV